MPQAAPADAAKVLLAALDEESLYTLAGGLKPVSCSFWQQRFDVGKPDLREVRSVRAALAVWRNEELWADVHAFDAAYEGHRTAQAYVVDRAALAALLDEHAAFFAPYGLLPDTHPAEVFAVVERMPELDRHRGLGLLFGYPLHAIDFFVASMADKQPGEKPSPRRFVNIPTFSGEQGRFVYAVPADQPDLPADRELRERAAPILARYRELRAAADVTDPAALQRIVVRLRAEFAPTSRLQAAASAR